MLGSVLSTLGVADPTCSVDTPIRFLIGQRKKVHVTGWGWDPRENNRCTRKNFRLLRKERFGHVHSRD
eukprot:scaffold301_cov370-Pavlova_lutheri.AAC.2